MDIERDEQRELHHAGGGKEVVGVLGHRETGLEVPHIDSHLAPESFGENGELLLKLVIRGFPSAGRFPWSPAGEKDEKSGEKEGESSEGSPSGRPGVVQPS
jgi:hypothetical protein